MKDGRKGRKKKEEGREKEGREKQGREGDHLRDCINSNRENPKDLRNHQWCHSSDQFPNCGEANQVRWLKGIKNYRR